MTHGAGLIEPISYMPSQAETCYDRFQGIVDKIRSCDDVLKRRKLEPAIAYIAHRMTEVIEQQLEQLGQIANEHVHASPESKQGRISEIEQHLDNLGMMCDQLVAAISDRPYAASVAAAGFEADHADFR